MGTWVEVVAPSRFARRDTVADGMPGELVGCKRFTLEGMTVVLLDERWPTLIPLEAYSRMMHPVIYTGELPVKVRWNLGDIILSTDPQGLGTIVSTNAMDPQVKKRIDAGEEVVEAASRKDPIYEAQQVMAQARSRGEWEMSQTHRSLLPYLHEEAEEFSEAVQCDAPSSELLSELGDLLLQVLFHAEIASRRGEFNFTDVATSFVEKMRLRSPYLFDGSTGLVPLERQERLWREGKAQQ